MIKKSDPTINELRKIFRDAGLEYYVKKQKGGIAKVHFMVTEEENAKT